MSAGETKETRLALGITSIDTPVEELWLPPDPLIFKETVPGIVNPLNIIVALFPGVTGFGVIFAVAPDGRPETANVTG